MGRPPLENKQRQLAVALPPDIRSELEKAAAAAGHSIAEEIRKRIALTFENERVDAATRELAADIIRLADDVRHQKGVGWHENDKARDTLIEAIKEWITGLGTRKPRPLRPTKSRVPGVSDLFWGDDDPATLGRSLARQWRHVKAAMEKSTEEMQNLHTEKKS